MCELIGAITLIKHFHEARVQNVFLPSLSFSFLGLSFYSSELMSSKSVLLFERGRRREELMNRFQLHSVEERKREK